MPKILHYRRTVICGKILQTENQECTFNIISTTYLTITTAFLKISKENFPKIKFAYLRTKTAENDNRATQVPNAVPRKSFAQNLIDNVEVCVTSTNDKPSQKNFKYYITVYSSL